MELQRDIILVKCQLEIMKIVRSLVGYKLLWVDTQHKEEVYTSKCTSMYIDLNITRHQAKLAP